MAKMIVEEYEKLGKVVGLQMERPGKFEQENSDLLRMPWTIERQLEAYARDPRHTERHETLFWSWKQLSRWLSNLLDYVIGTFQTYSRHDETHCRAVLHNIECLLGEDEIRRLSPTDCFGILIAVYLHDIGMCVGEDDKEEMITSDKFYYTLEELEESQDPKMREAVAKLRETDYKIEYRKGSPEEIRKNFKELCREKLSIYNAVSLLLGEHSRGIHARRSKEKVYEWVKESDEAQSGFSMTGIPLRIFLQLAECAAMHNEGSAFKDIASTLLECDNGYAYDQYHPRFIAVMLMLGDILDVDNNRFNPFVKEMAGKTFSDSSEIHYQKHRAIRALRISPKIISVQADCAGTDELRLLRRDFDWLERFLQDCNYHWGEIAPDNFQGCLPALSFEKIRLEGQEIPSDLVSSKFLISQRKAFRLLQGANLYANRFVFLRELLQNAIDATKRQYWDELEAVETDSSDIQDLVSTNKVLPLKRYPIHIDFLIKKRLKGSNDEPLDVTVDDFKEDLTDFHQKYELGVLLQIQDSGIGISQEDIRAISEVGTSHDRDRSVLSRMPEWLRPNGRFGIGLQSVFLVGNTFQCVTHTRRGERYKITFHSGATGDGHIDVIPYSEKDHVKEKIPFGTCFSVFVPESYREDRSKNVVGWIGADPYDEKYQVWGGIRGAAELMRQMEDYLDDQIGEWIFPVILREFPLHPSLRDIKEKVFPQKELRLKHAIRQPVCEKDIEKSGWVPLRETGNEWLNWLFKENADFKCLQGPFDSGSAGGDTGVYRIEIDNGCIKIWSQKMQCFFCCSPARILEGGKNGERSKTGRKKRIAEDENDGRPKADGKIHIYTKGLFVSEIEYPGNELLEYIDIESDVLQDGLQMDRDSLTEKGKTCLREEVIPTLLQTFYGVLQYINRIIDGTVQDHQRKIIHALEDEYSHILEGHVDSDAERKRILSSFKIRLSELSRQNYVLFELQRKRTSRQSKEETQGEQTRPECPNRVSIMEQDDADQLFSNDLISIIDSDDYVAFEQKHGDKDDRIRQDRQRMVRALNRAATYTTEIDYVTIFLQDFLERLDNIMSLIVNGRNVIPEQTTTGQRRNEQRPLTSELRQAKVRLLSDKLQGYVFLYGMFFFHVNQSGVSACLECVQEDNCPCYWQFVNDKIADILRYAINKLQNMWEKEESSYKGNPEFRENVEEFQKALYVHGVEEETPGIMEYYSIADILKNENHFAVFSTRQTKEDIWKHLLIRLSPFGQRFLDYSSDLTVFDVLNTPPGSPADCVERWSFLDRWNKEMIERMRKEHILSSSGESYEHKMPNLNIWGSRRVWWMIHHYPTLSLGSDVEGNNRINVLGRKVNPHVFVDARTVLLILERAKERAPAMAAPRFQTTVWDGFAALKVKEPSGDIMTITRGVLSDRNKENIMLLGLPYNLPEAACLPYDKTNPKAVQIPLSSAGLLTLSQLMDYIREAYSNPGEKNWDTLEQQAIINQCETVIDFTPFRFESEGDWALAEWIRDYYKTQYSEENWDRSLTSNQQSVMLEAFQGQFEACIKDAWQSMEGEELLSSCTSWTQLDLPVNRKAYITLFLLKVYGVNPDTAVYSTVEELSRYLSALRLPDSDKEKKFKETTKKLCYALIYCAYYAEEEYRTAFLKDICAWWKEDIWDNDPGRELFLRKSAQQTGLQTDELERLYMAQVRRIICSALSGTTSYLESIKELSKVKAVVRDHLPSELKELFRKSSHRLQGGER